MYSKSSWGGPVDPFILVKFTDVGKDHGEDPIVSLIIFDWIDEDYIGVESDGGFGRIAVCEPDGVAAGLCKQEQIGEFILAPNATDESANPILTKAVHLKDSSPIRYPVNKTGYFCVVTDNRLAGKYQAIVEFRNAYGELSAAQIPKLPFYGGITIAYALLLVYVETDDGIMNVLEADYHRFWGFLYFQYRSDICRSCPSQLPGLPADRAQCLFRIT